MLVIQCSKVTVNLQKDTWNSCKTGSNTCKYGCDSCKRKGKRAIGSYALCVAECPGDSYCSPEYDYSCSYTYYEDCNCSNCYSGSNT